MRCSKIGITEHINDKGINIKIKYINILILLSTIIYILSLPSISLAKWSDSFVVYDQYIYVITKEQVKEIDKEIGKVTKYSDDEGQYYGNFSNTYKEGTKYYSIKGVKTEIAIAVEGNGKYIKAIREGKYIGKSPIKAMSGVSFICFAVALLIFLFKRK